MEEIRTQDLDEMLKGVKVEELTSFTKDIAQYIERGDKAFYYYVKDVLDSKNIQLKEMYARADVSESYGSKIISMVKHTKDRDLIIRFCLGGHFNLDETNRALKLYGYSPLYSKNKRDVIIIVAINNRCYQISDVNSMLIDAGFDALIKNN
ncbi:MAG: hypothetical protein MJ093_07495 [Saccharofermentans sp.]|nr:hypothetical protein [Saccharofermentans sp.]